MLKFFRRYNKILLVVFGSFLMVVFLLPAKGGWGDPSYSDEVIGATADGKSFTVADQRAAAAELDLLHRLRPQDNLLPEDGLTLLLLLHEARANGLYVSRDQAHQIMLAMAKQSVPIAQMLNSLGISEDQFVTTLQNGSIYDELRQLMAGVTHLSDPRLRREAMDMLSPATVEMVCVDASYLADSLPDPAAAEIDEQFKKYQAAKPGSTEPYGFGYAQPARVKLEYIAVPMKDVTASIKATDLDGARYHQDHPERFMPPAAPEPVVGKDGKVEPTPPVRKGPLPYAEVRDQAIKEFTEEAAAKKHGQIVKEIVVLLNEATGRLKTNDDGYLVIPADYKPADLEEVAKTVQKDFGVLPTVVRIDKFLTFQEIAELPDFGRATLDVAGQQLGAASYISITHELTPKPTAAAASLRLQAQAPSRVLTDADNTSYIFQLRAVDPPHDPKSLDEPGIREQVVRDIKRAKAYEQLKKMEADLIPQVRKDGLEKVAEAYKTKKEVLDRVTGRDEATMGKPFVDAVFAMARKVQDAGGKDKAPAELLLTTIAVDKTQKVCVVKLVDYQPLDSDTYKQLSPMLMNMLIQGDMREMNIQQALSRDAVEKRVGWKPAEGYGERRKKDMPTGTPQQRPDYVPGL